MNAKLDAVDQPMPKTDEARSSNTAVMNDAMPATHNSWMAWPKALVKPPPASAWR